MTGKEPLPLGEPPRHVQLMLWWVRTWSSWWLKDRWRLIWAGWSKMPDGTWVPGSIARAESLRQHHQRQAAKRRHPSS